MHVTLSTEGFDATEGQLMGQIRTIRNSNCFTSMEMQANKKEVLGEETQRYSEMVGCEEAEEDASLLLSDEAGRCVDSGGNRVNEPEDTFLNHDSRWVRRSLTRRWL